MTKLICVARLKHHCIDFVTMAEEEGVRKKVLLRALASGAQPLKTSSKDRARRELIDARIHSPAESAALKAIAILGYVVPIKEFQTEINLI